MVLPGTQSNLSEAQPAHPPAQPPPPAALTKLIWTRVMVYPKDQVSDMTLVVSPPPVWTGVDHVDPARYPLNSSDRETARDLVAYLPKFERLDLRTLDVRSKLTPDGVLQIQLPVAIHDVFRFFDLVYKHFGSSGEFVGESVGVNPPAPRGGFAAAGL